MINDYKSQDQLDKLMMMMMMMVKQTVTRNEKTKQTRTFMTLCVYVRLSNLSEMSLACSWVSLRMCVAQEVKKLRPLFGFKEFTLPPPTLHNPLSSAPPSSALSSLPLSSSISTLFSNPHTPTTNWPVHRSIMRPLSDPHAGHHIKRQRQQSRLLLTFSFEAQRVSLCVCVYSLCACEKVCVFCLFAHI